MDTEFDLMIESIRNQKDYLQVISMLGSKCYSDHLLKGAVDEISEEIKKQIFVYTINLNIEQKYNNCFIVIRYIIINIPVNEEQFYFTEIFNAIKNSKVSYKLQSAINELIEHRGNDFLSFIQKQKTPVYAEMIVEYLVRFYKFESYIKFLKEVFKITKGVNFRLEDNKSPIFYANSSVMRNLLLEHGADVNLRDNQGNTAICYSRNEEIAKIFLQHGATIDQRTALLLIKSVLENNSRLSSEFFNELLSYNLEIDANTATDILHNTLRYRELTENILVKLLNYGAVMPVEDVLYYFDKSNKNISEDMLDKLLEQGLDINKKNEEGMPKFLFLNSINTLKYFIIKGLDVNATDVNGKNIFFYYNREYRIKMFIDSGAKINNTDNNGNSALYYHLMKQYYKQMTLIRMLFANGAKYIRNHREERNKLHIAVALDDSSIKVDKSLVNKVDMQGKLPLHYALELGRSSWTNLLIGDTDCTMEDNYNRSAMDYAILNGDIQSIKLIMSSESAKKEAGILTLFRLYEGKISLFKSINDIEKKRTSSLVNACYSGKRECYDFIIRNIELIDPIDLEISNAVAKNNLPLDRIHLYKPLEQLVIIAALCSISPELEHECKGYIKNNIFPLLRKNTNIKFFNPFGFEVEIPNQPKFALIPTKLLLDLSHVNLDSDLSVFSDIFMIKPYKEEIVTKIIHTSHELEDCLFVLEQLHTYGAIINKTAGFHVHVNIRGNDREVQSIAKSMDLPQEIIVTDVELMLVKQILKNWSCLEPLLRGFVRGGDLYDYTMDKESYTKPLNNIISEMLTCQSIDKMTKGYADRNMAINVSSLSVYGDKCHGTLEFRMHESTTNPILIVAWLNFIDRLLKISVRQIKDKISFSGVDPKTDSYTAYENIEYLVYMLLAEQNHNLTWNKVARAFEGASVLPAEGEIPMQMEFISSSLYEAYRLSKEGKDFSNIFCETSESSTELLQNDLKIMLILNQQFPGVLNEENYDCSHSKKMKLYL